MTTKTKREEPQTMYPSMWQQIAQTIRQIQRRQAVTELELTDSLRMIPGGSLRVDDYHRRLDRAMLEPPFKVGDIVYKKADSQRTAGEIVFWDDLRDIGRAQFKPDGIPEPVNVENIEKVEVIHE